ncbi:MAG: N-acetyltransferase family protein [Collinsella sp.]
MEFFPYLVAELDGRLVGYAYAGTFKGRPAYDWAVETSIYVAQGHAGEGIGRALHDALERALAAQGILNMYACIAVPDGEDDETLTRNSQHFHEHMGYRLVGEFYQCGFKGGRWYDMIWMEKILGEHLCGPTSGDAVSRPPSHAWSAEPRPAPRRTAPARTMPRRFHKYRASALAWCVELQVKRMVMFIKSGGRR